MTTRMASQPSATVAELENMPHHRAEFEEIWAYLYAGLEHIMTSEERLSHRAYTAIHGTVYAYCTSPRKQSTARSLGTRTGADLVGEELYKELSTYLISRVERIQRKLAHKGDIELLRDYAYEWDRYMRGAASLRSLFSHLDRHWIKRERDEGKKNIYEVHTLALVQWKTHLFVPIQESGPRLIIPLLKLIAQERNGEVVDQNLLRTVTDSFSRLRKLEVMGVTTT